MKRKFWFLTFLLLFARGCDFYSTSLWFFQPNGWKHELNPIVSVFGGGWNSLIVVNVIIVGLVVWAFYRYSFHYKPTRFEPLPTNFRDYGSLLYYNQKAQFYKILYKIPTNRKAAFAHFGYVLMRVCIVVSFIAAAFNLCQFYDVKNFDVLLEAVGKVVRPYYLIIAFSVGLCYYFNFRILKREFLETTTPQ